MIKNIIVLALILIIFSCYSTKNDYDVERFKTSRFRIQPNQNKDYIKYIDTTVFYLTVLPKEEVEIYNLENYQTGYKFYGNGRVGLFKGVNFNDLEEFNPKKATMGYYNYDGTNFYMESFYKIPGGTYKLSKQEILLDESFGDTLIIGTVESSTSSRRKVKFVKINMPFKALNFSPDW